MRASDKKFMDERIEKYPFLAEAPTAIKPTMVTFCEHASCRLRYGWRLWMFQTSDDQQKFITIYNGCAYP